MMSLSDNNKADVIEAINSTSRYLDVLPNCDNPYFDIISFDQSWSLNTILAWKLFCSKAYDSQYFMLIYIVYTFKRIVEKPSVIKRY